MAERIIIDKLDGNGSESFQNGTRQNTRHEIDPVSVTNGQNLIWVRVPARAPALNFHNK